MENERKFLVKELPNLDNCEFYRINQGYISFSPEVRIRKKDNRHYLTYKGEGTQIREENETSLDESAYEILLMALQGRLIDKTRYEIKLYDGLIAELDIYHGDLSGLFTVETEFKTEEQADTFKIPDWFGDEITCDKRYKNKNLARMEQVKDLIPLADKKILKKEQM